MRGVTEVPLITSSSRSNEHKKNQRRGSRVQIIQSNGQEKDSLDSARKSHQLPKREQPANQLSAARDISGRKREEKLEMRMRSYSNLYVSPGFKAGPEQSEILPPPPHFHQGYQADIPQQLNRLQTNLIGNIKRQRTTSMPKKKLEINVEDGSRSSSRRQQISVGLPKPKNEALGPTSHGNLFGQSNSSQHTEKESSIDARLEIPGQSLKRNVSVIVHQIPTDSVKSPQALFNFDELNRKRQQFKEELAARKAFTIAKTAALTPFETFFTKKSCLDFLEEAREYLFDESMRVSKTPAGFNRPRDERKKKLLKNQNLKDLTSKMAQKSDSANFLARKGTKRLDSGEVDPTSDASPLLDARQKPTIELQDARETVNLAQKLDSSPKHPPRMPLQNRHQTPTITGDSQSHYSGKSEPQSQPIVFVTKYGMPLTAEEFQDVGFSKYNKEKIEEETKIAIQASLSQKSAMHRDHSFILDSQLRERVNQVLKKNLPEYEISAQESKLNMMTKRLLYEDSIDRIFLNHKPPNRWMLNVQGESTEDRKQFIAVVSKLNQEMLVQKHRDMQARNKKVSLTEFSLQDIAQRSLEEAQLQTHATSSNDSQFQTQNPVARPKFNSDLPADYWREHSPDISIADRFNSAKKSHNQSPIGLKGASTLRQSKQDAQTSGLNQSSPTVRRRVFGLSQNKKLSPIQTRGFNFIENETLPILVQHVEKTDIDEMEGKQHLVLKVNAKVGQDDTGRSQIRVGSRDQLRLVPLGSHATAGMGFDKDRKSYDTAHLGGVANYYAESEQRAVSAGGIGKAENIPSSPIPLSLDGDYADQKIQPADLQKHNLGTRAAKSNITLRPAAQGTESNDLTSSEEIRSTVDERGRTMRKDSLIDAKKNQNLHGPEGSASLGERLVNISVKPSREGRKSTQISMLSANQLLRLSTQSRGQNRQEQLKELKQKQKQIFPFQSSNEKKRKNKNRSSDYSLCQKDGAGEKKIIDSLFALRRANKNRRQQLQRATNDKKNRIVHSQIPGVDYSRQEVQQSKADNEKLFDGAKLNAVQETTAISGIGTTLVFPINVMQKMAQQSFVVIQRHVQAKKDLTDKNQ